MQVSIHSRNVANEHSKGNKRTASGLGDVMTIPGPNMFVSITFDVTEFIGTGERSYDSEKTIEKNVKVKLDEYELVRIMESFIEEGVPNLSYENALKLSKVLIDHAVKKKP